MDDKTFYSILVSIVLAFVGIGAKYANDLSIARRKDRLDRINQQLRLLYGPLYALSRASRHSWLAFNRQYRPDGSPFWTDPPPPEVEQEVWRTWMATVLMPLNTQMAKVVTDNADLLDEPEIPDCLVRLCAHVAAYQPMLKAWERREYGTFNPVKFPYALRQYTKRSFIRLKGEQQRLLGHRPRGKPNPPAEPIKGRAGMTAEPSNAPLQRPGYAGR